MVRERIEINRVEVDFVEMDILNRVHIERYCAVRKFCEGVVLDVGCGCGYGSYLIAKNPDVKGVVGVDVNESAVLEAGVEFSSGRVTFVAQNLNNIGGCYDVLVALEIVEHLERPKELNDLFMRSKAKRLVVSYPTKKTTHYNPYHFHDFEVIDIVSLFNGKCVRNFDVGVDCKVMVFEKEDSND